MRNLTRFVCAALLAACSEDAGVGTAEQAVEYTTAGDTAVRCSNWSWWDPVWQPDPWTCFDYCSAYGADACEWHVSGDCYVEFGTDCYLAPGYEGWWGAIEQAPPAPQACGSFVAGSGNAYSDWVYLGSMSKDACSCACAGYECCDWNDNGDCYGEWGNCTQVPGYPGWHSIGSAAPQPPACDSTCSACGTYNGCGDYCGDCPPAEPPEGEDGQCGVSPNLGGNRQRLIETLASRRGFGTCELWEALTEGERYVFYTITHVLASDASDIGGCATLLDHVDNLYSLNGPGGWTAAEDANCGGGEFNRIYLGFDDVGIAAVRARTGDWTGSQDLAGPHHPFTRSNYIQTGGWWFLSHGPQIHYLRDDSEWTDQRRADLSDRRGMCNAPDDSRVVEIDIDYNTAHDSNPLCGDAYQSLAQFGDGDYGWQPTGCDSAGTSPPATKAGLGCVDNCLRCDTVDCATGGNYDPDPADYVYSDGCGGQIDCSATCSQGEPGDGGAGGGAGGGDPCAADPYQCGCPYEDACDCYGDCGACDAWSPWSGCLDCGAVVTYCYYQEGCWTSWDAWICDDALWSCGYYGCP